MGDITRRDAVKLLAAGLASGTGALATAADAQDEATDAQQPAANASESNDPVLDTAIQNPQGFMFVEEVSFPFDRPGYDLFITSARHSGKRGLRVPSGSMRIFRADADLDEFTRQGGVHWKSDQRKGKFQFNQPGALVMIVRESETVRCYSLQIDLRC